MIGIDSIGMGIFIVLVIVLGSWYIRVSLVVLLLIEGTVGFYSLGLLIWGYRAWVH